MRYLIAILIAVTLATVGLRGPPAEAATQPPCLVSGGQLGALSVPRGTSIRFVVFAFCPGSTSITLAVHVAGVPVLGQPTVGYTLAETVAVGLYTFYRFDLPTDVLPPGAYTGYTEGNGARGASFGFTVT